MWLTMLKHARVCVNTFEWVLNETECNWMQLTGIEGICMGINAIESVLNAIKLWLNALEYAWMPLSVHGT